MTITRQRPIRAALALVGALALSACGSARYPAYYMLHAEPSRQPPAQTRDAGTLAIRDLRCPDYLCEGRIVYRPTPAEVAFYQYHRWAVSPPAMVAQFLAERVRARSLFTRVSGEESRVGADFVLDGTLERLEEVDEGRDVAAVCSISAQLVDTRTRSVVWSLSATERVAVEQRDVAGVVKGLTFALGATVDRLIADMESQLGRLTAPNKRP